MSLALTRRLLAAACLLLATAALAPAADEVVYPARVTTMQGRMFPIRNLGHEYEEGSFLFHDGETQARVQWRDLDRITFIGNLGHQPGAYVAGVPKTRRATLRFLDGTERQVELVIGRIFGHDGLDSRSMPPSSLAVIDFEEIDIAPAQVKTCLRGHVWEHPDYAYCPYDGLSLTTTLLR